MAAHDHMDPRVRRSSVPLRPVSERIWVQTGGASGFGHRGEESALEEVNERPRFVIPVHFVSSLEISVSRLLVVLPVPGHSHSTVPSIEWGFPFSKVAVDHENAEDASDHGVSAVESVKVLNGEEVTVGDQTFQRGSRGVSANISDTHGKNREVVRNILLVVSFARILVVTRITVRDKYSVFFPAILSGTLPDRFKGFFQTYLTHGGSLRLLGDFSSDHIGVFLSRLKSQGLNNLDLTREDRETESSGISREVKLDVVGKGVQSVLPVLVADRQRSVHDDNDIKNGVVDTWAVWFTNTDVLAIISWSSGWRNSGVLRWIRRWEGSGLVSGRQDRWRGSWRGRWQ